MLTGLLPVFKVMARLGAIGAKIGGMGATAFGIRQIWYTASEEQSWQSKALLSTLYALHMGSISLTTAVLFGATDVTAPVATALVCSTALLKNIGDLVVEKTNQMGLARKHWDLEHQLSLKNNDFHTNLTLLEDLKETDDAIDALLKQQQECHEYLKLTRRQSTLEALWNTLKEQDAAAIVKSKTIRAYFAKVDGETFDPDIAIKELLQKSAQLKVEGNQQKLDEVGTIQLQCIKYKRVLLILKEINLLIGSLPPSAHSEKNDYLLKRKNELESRLRNMQQGNVECFPIGFIEKMQKKSPAAFKRSLQKYLQDRVTILGQKITQQQLLLVEKRDYLCRPIDFAPLVEQIKGISAVQNQLWIARLNQNAKSNNVDSGSISAVIALVLAMVPSEEVSKYLHPMMLCIGVLAGAVSLVDLYKRYQATHKMTENETKKMKQFLLQKKFQIAKLGDAHLRKILTTQLENILQDKNTVTPIASEQLVVNQARVAKLTAKQTIYELSQATESAVLEVRTRSAPSRR